jgi:SAM-dependent methyltransferase
MGGEMAVESPDVPWARNHDEHGLPPRVGGNPAKAAEFFRSFLKARKIESGVLADLGCGTGRNALLFAKGGFEVHAIDRSEGALAPLARHGVNVYSQDLAECWLFTDGSFDFAMDVFCYSQEKDEGRKAAYRAELIRSLRAGGYFLLTVPSRVFQKSLIEKEFSGFSILACEQSVEKIAGGKVDSLSLIMKKR